jgi:hypothetical protein
MVFVTLVLILVKVTLLRDNWTCVALLPDAVALLNSKISFSTDSYEIGSVKNLSGQSCLLPSDLPRHGTK